MDNNTNYTKNLFAFASEFDIPICYASSAATYGAGEYGYDDNEEEIDKLLPLNAYGYSKQLVDEWVSQLPMRPSVWFGLKFFNVYGPNEYHKGNMRSVVQQAHEQIKEHGNVRLFKSYKDEFKDGEQLRDFIYVKDIVNAMLTMMEEANPEKSGIYNLGTGEARSFNDLVEAVFKAMNEEVDINYIEMPGHLKNQYQYFTQAKMEKFSRNFPSFEFSSLESGVEDYVKNHLEQENSYLG